MYQVHSVFTDNGILMGYGTYEKRSDAIRDAYFKAQCMVDDEENYIANKNTKYFYTALTWLEGEEDLYFQIIKAEKSNDTEVIEKSSVYAEFYILKVYRITDNNCDTET